MKLTKALTILVIFFFVAIANASIYNVKIENSFLNDSIEERYSLYNGCFFIFGKVTNVDKNTQGGYDHVWTFDIIKVLVISQEKPKIGILTDKYVLFGYDVFYGFLGNNFVCAIMSGDIY